MIAKGRGKRKNNASKESVYASNPDAMFFSATDRAPQLHHNENCPDFIMGEHGYRSARANHGVAVGSYYCEFIIHKTYDPEAHVRIGWATTRADIQAPIGHDSHGFSIVDVNGGVYHKGAVKQFSPLARPFGPGDVVGIFIKLPELDKERICEMPEDVDGKPPMHPCNKPNQQVIYKNKGTEMEIPGNCAINVKDNEEEDMEIDNNSIIENNNNNSKDDENASFSTMPSELIRQIIPAPHPGSEIRFVLNGVDLGPAFVNIPQGRYYPAVSLFHNALVEINGGRLNGSDTRPMFECMPKFNASLKVLKSCADINDKIGNQEKRFSTPKEYKEELRSQNSEEGVIPFLPMSNAPKNEKIIIRTSYYASTDACPLVQKTRM